MGKKILTLNVGASSVVLAEYEANGTRLQLVNYGKAALTAPVDAGNAEAVLTPALWEIIRERNIKPGAVAISLSGQMVFPRFAAIPPISSAEKFDAYVRNEIEQNVPFPIDEMVCDRQVLGDTPGGDKSVMIVAAKIDQVEAITSAVQAAGFKPDLVGVAPIAVTNVLKATGAAEECSILLDIGAKTTSLVIVEGDMLYNRSIPVAGNTITKDIAQLLGCSQEEAEEYKCTRAYVSMGGVMEDEDETLDRVSKVCRATMTRLHAEISRSINFYRSQQGGGAPTKLYLTGGTSLLPQLAEFFQDSLGIEVEYLNPLALVAVGPQVDATQLESDAALLTATTGLALQSVKTAPLTIDLMPPAILDARAEVARIPFVAIGSAALVLAALCWMFSAKSAASKAAERSVEIEERAEAAEQRTQSVTEAEEAFKQDEAEAQRLIAQLARRDSALGHLETVRTCLVAAVKDNLKDPEEKLVPELWITRWEEAVKTEEAAEEPAGGNRRSRSRTRGPSTSHVMELTFRVWASDAAKLKCSPQEAVVEKLEEAFNPDRRKSVVTLKAFPVVTHGPEHCLQEYKLKLTFNKEQE